MILSSIVAAVGLFVATNIDDIIILSLFFSRGAGQPGTFRRILVGQYIGFVGILALSVLAAVGSAAVLPPDAVPYFGLIPLGIGLWAVWEAWREDEDGGEAQVRGKQLSVATVAAVTFANGGDNVGVYVPVFLQVSRTAVAVYCVVFLVLVAGLVWVARYITSRPRIARALDRWENILFPAVMIVLGVAILSSAFIEL